MFENDRIKFAYICQVNKICQHNNLENYNKYNGNIYSRKYIYIYKNI